MPEESAPLLNEDQSVVGDEALSEAAWPSRTAKFFKLLRIFTLVFSTLILILIIANYIILAIAPFGYVYRQRHVNKEVIGWIIASFVASLINVIFVDILIVFNIVADTTFAVGIIVSVVQWIGSMPFSDCSNRWDNRGGGWIPPDPKCKDWKLALNIIMGFTAAFMILLAACYVILLLLRAYELLKNKVWKGIPIGEVNCTLSLNVITDGQERTYGLTLGAKAGAKAPHGPVHL